MSTHKAINKLRSTEDGLTLIECLVAIAVIAVTVSAIAPMLVFSVATRVQSQKTNQALLLAQGEIDKIRLTVEQGGDYGDRLNELRVVTADASVTDVANVGAPDTFVDDPDDVNSVDEARRVDIDGDGDTDFAIQLFRTVGIELPPDNGGTANTPVAFEVGVRVYDARSEGNTLVTEEAGLAFTSGVGDRDSQPLAVLYSQVAQGDRNGSLCQYWQYTGTEPVSLSCN